MSQQQPEHPYAERYREQWGPQPPQQVIYQQVVRQPSNGQATGAMVLGIIAAFFGLTVPVPIWGLFMVFLAGPSAIVAVILGHLGLKTAARMGTGRAAALAGLVLGYITLGVIALTIAFWIVAYVVGSASNSNA